MNGDTSYSVNVKIAGLEEIKEKMYQINSLILDIEMLAKKMSLLKVDVSVEPKENGHASQGNG